MHRQASVQGRGEPYRVLSGRELCIILLHLHALPRLACYCLHPLPAPADLLADSKKPLLEWKSFPSEKGKRQLPALCYD